MDIVREEIFGPVAIVVEYSELKNEVTEPENRSQHGLTASLFTRDLTRGVEVANELQAGTVWINCMNKLHPNVPFGGFKQSGIGRECGESALYTCVLHLPFLAWTDRTIRVYIIC
jgi:aldehyde dehydrogenase (NAD+)